MLVKPFPLKPTRTIPNSRLPLLYYPNAFPENATPSQIEAKFRSNGWIPQVSTISEQSIISIVAIFNVPRSPLPFNDPWRSGNLPRHRKTAFRRIEWWQFRRCSGINRQSGWRHCNSCRSRALCTYRIWRILHGWILSWGFTSFLGGFIYNRVLRSGICVTGEIWRSRLTWKRLRKLRHLKWILLEARKGLLRIIGSWSKAGCDEWVSKNGPNMG